MRMAPKRGKKPCPKEARPTMPKPLGKPIRQDGNHEGQTTKNVKDSGNVCKTHLTDQRQLKESAMCYVGKILQSSTI